MQYSEFLKKAEKWGEGARVSCTIEEKEVKDARLHKEGGDWYICQNICDGLDCRDKMGYEYSYVVCNSANLIENFTLLSKTLYTLEVGDMVVNKNGQEQKVLEVLTQSCLLSYFVKHGVPYDWFTFKQLERYGYIVKNTQPVEETVMTVAEIEKKLGISNLKIKKEE